jgi:hypothetical protein
MCGKPLERECNSKVNRFHGSHSPVVTTLDFESKNPSSKLNLARSVARAREQGLVRGRLDDESSFKVKDQLSFSRCSMLMATNSLLKHGSMPFRNFFFGFISRWREQLSGPL